MCKRIIFTKNAPGPVGPYSQAIEAHGFLFISGQIPTVLGDIKEQTREVLNNIKAILEGAGYNLDNIVKTAIYLTDLTKFPEVNEVYKEFFPKEPPARSTVGVSDLPKGVGIEIEAIAMCEASPRA